MKNLKDLLNAMHGDTNDCGMKVKIMFSNDEEMNSMHIKVFKTFICNNMHGFIIYTNDHPTIEIIHVPDENAVMIGEISNGAFSTFSTFCSISEISIGKDVNIKPILNAIAESRECIK